MAGWALSSWHVVRLVNVRHLFGRRRRTLLTLAGIAASVALVVAITVVNETLRGAIDETTRGLAGGAALEVAPSTAAALPPGTSGSLRAVPGVRAVVPLIREITVLRHGRSSNRTFVFGVPANLRVLFPQGLGDAGAELARARHGGGALVSPGLAAALHAQGGDRLAVTTAAGAVGLRLAGVVQHAPFAAVNGGDFALLPLGLARRVFGQRGTGNVAYLTLDGSRLAAAVRRSIRARLGAATMAREPGGGAKPYRRTFDSIALLSEQTRVVALLVALFLVFNTMSMALAERREELVLLRLNGTRRTEIVTGFVLEAAILGFIGSAAGVAAGTVLARALIQHAADAYSILPLTTAGSVIVSPGAIALGLGTGIAVSVLGAALPAARILRVEPIEALRPEASYEWSGKRIRGRPVLAAAGILVLLGVAAIAALVQTEAHTWAIGVSFAGGLLGAALLLPSVVPLLVGVLRRSLLLPLGMVGRLAGDTLLRNPARTIVVAGALALSASVVISVGSGLASYDGEIERATSVWYVTPLFVNAPGPAIYTSDQPLPDSLGGGLSRVPGVRAAYPLRFGLVDEAGRQLMVYAMPIAEAAAAGDRITASIGIPERRLVAAMRRGEIVMSRYTARRRGLRAGDLVELPNLAGRRRLRIAGLFNDLATFDSLYMELSDYRRLTGDNVANRFAVVLRPGARAGAVAAALRRYLRRRGVPASVLSRSQMRAEVLNTVEGLFSLAKSVQLAALLLAGLIALNTMLTATFERRREFGVQRTIGMSPTQLAGSVILESVAVALVAGIIAIGLGLGLGFLMTLMIENQLAWQIAFAPPLGITAGTVAAILAIGALAALYPSWRASRQRLVDLVGYE